MQKEEKKLQSKSQQKVKEKPRKKLKAEADKWFSLYIRLNASDWRGYCKCYTCGKIDHYKRMQCGHFVSRSSTKLRFDERNSRVQCAGCNLFKSGNYIEYTMRLINEKGKKFVDNLISDGKEIVQFSDDDLENIANKYKLKVKGMDNYE